MVSRATQCVRQGLRHKRPIESQWCLDRLRPEQLLLLSIKGKGATVVDGTPSVVVVPDVVIVGLVTETAVVDAGIYISLLRV